MNINRLQECRRRYIAIYGNEPVPLGVIYDIESALQVSLPDDLKDIACFYSGGILGGIEHTAIEATGPSAM